MCVGHTTNTVSQYARRNPRAGSAIERKGLGPECPGRQQNLRSRLQQDSYIIVNNIFDPDADLGPLYDEWRSVLDGIATRFTADGLLASPLEELPFEQRLVAVTKESGQHISGQFDISLPQGNIHRDTPVCASPAMFRLLTNEKLLDVVEELIGPRSPRTPFSTSA